MAQRKNKKRKQNLLKYKIKKVMSESKAPEMQPFRQVPNWSSTEKFEISGEEFGALYNFLNIFAPAITAVQQIFARGFKEGKVKVSYEDLEGNAISDKEIDNYTEKLNAYFQAQQGQTGTVVDADEPTTHAKIVSFTGEKIDKADIAANEAASLVTN